MTSTEFYCGQQKIVIGQTLGHRTLQIVENKPTFQISYFLVTEQGRDLWLVSCRDKSQTKLNHDLGPDWFIAEDSEDAISKSISESEIKPPDASETAHYHKVALIWAGLSILLLVSYLVMRRLQFTLLSLILAAACVLTVLLALRYYRLAKGVSM